MIDLLKGRDAAALNQLRAAERLATRLAPGQVLAMMIRRWLLPTLARLGQTEQVDRTLAGLDEREHDDAQIRIALGWIRILEKDAAAAIVALARVLDGSAPVSREGVDRLRAFLIEAIARDMLGETQASRWALERALDLAEPDGMRWAFLLHTIQELLERHRQGRTAHEAFVSDLLDMLAGSGPHPPLADAGELSEQLSETELRVLRFLPSNLSASEIAAELFVSISTVKTHLRHIYAKLGVHVRSKAVTRGRELGIPAPVATLRR